MLKKKKKTICGLQSSRLLQAEVYFPLAIGWNELWLQQLLEDISLIMHSSVQHLFFAAGKRDGKFLRSLRADRRRKVTLLHFKLPEAREGQTHGSAAKCIQKCSNNTENGKNKSWCAEITDISGTLCKHGCLCLALTVLYPCINIYSWGWLGDTSFLLLSDTNRLLTAKTEQ